jgi:hypothetical protein
MYAVLAAPAMVPAGTAAPAFTALPKPLAAELTCEAMSLVRSIPLFTTVVVVLAIVLAVEVAVSATVLVTEVAVFETVLTALLKDFLMFQPS